MEIPIHIPMKNNLDIRNKYDGGKPDEKTEREAKRNLMDALTV